MPKKTKENNEVNELKKASSKSTSQKTSTSTAKKTSTKRNTTKKETTLNMKTSATKKVTTSKKSSTSINKKSIQKRETKIMEYYDLPYRYNQTMVKILAQTPTTLFVYWDISDIDRINFIEKYGEDFFNKTKPILLIYNKTKNYYLEVEINDFANSWYLHMQEPNCEYEIELRRRNIENPSQYIHVSSSNQLVSPNDHVLFEETDFTNVKFKNVKTGTISEKDFGSIHLMTNVGNIYNKKHKVYHFYNNLFKDEILENTKMFSNPSSGNPTSGMF
ncbi:MAG: DUF4912 domain-containing protein [Clostridia bacterium]|nr:DUF4912 domain-containing protein [Clostridia bacterium]